MKFEKLGLDGAVLVHLEPHADDRGFFARAFCEKEFEEHGLPARFPQANLSLNRERLTLRGMHYQAAPHREAKLVRCVAGALHDVIVDLRAGSPTRGQWLGVPLDAEKRSALFVPAGFAHGFLTLTPGTEVFYQMGASYVPEASRGFRWNDPRFAIEWPETPLVLSDRDRDYPNFDPDRFDG